MSSLPRPLGLLLEKGTLELVDCPSLGYYSWLFLLQMMLGGGGWRLMVDLSLNGCITQAKFKMETVSLVLRSIMKGNFMISIYLKDTYFQIPIYSDSQPYLWIVLGGKVSQFKALCFSLSTAPQVFIRLFDLVRSRLTGEGSTPALSG